MTHAVVTQVTQRIVERSRASRESYLQRMHEAANETPHRSALGCGNLAHGFAACAPDDKATLKGDTKANIAIVSAYNDMLSAHQPYKSFPDIIKQAAHASGAVAQFAGGVPAMCDGVTQGQPGMELSLFSRDVIAMATAVALSHNMFDAALCLGICDKIVPGLLIGALSFGHLPVVFVPGGPMPSGLPNDEKQKAREAYAKGELDRAGLLEAESQSYHAPGTCTFYGTANSNQMLMEIMGLQLPGSSFVQPQSDLRTTLTQAATQQALALTALQGDYTPLCDILDERGIVNGIVGLHATGGSTNHTLHLIAIARAAGIKVTWDDFAALSDTVPLLCRIYPNGSADVNHFHAAGGMATLIHQLLEAGLLHADVQTVMRQGLRAYCKEPFTNGDELAWRDGSTESRDSAVLASVKTPHASDGGMRLLQGRLGRAIMKTSALSPEQHKVKAPCRIFLSQQALHDAFEAGELHRDVVAVVLYQGPSANGMPELHRLTPPLGVLQKLGYKVALVTDGRMSGASGKIPAAIHVTPECAHDGALAKLRDGDVIELDADKGVLEVHIDDAEWQARTPVAPDSHAHTHGMGRELFAQARRVVNSAEEGASFIQTGEENG